MEEAADGGSPVLLGSQFEREATLLKPAGGGDNGDFTADDLEAGAIGRLEDKSLGELSPVG